MDQQPAPPMLPAEAAPAEEDGLILVESAGIIPFFPSIMALQPDNEEFNASQCICSDLQHEDYSPLYAWFNYIVIIIMLPSLSAFGVITNVVNVFVYSRPRMRNSSNTYLLFLACSDFFVVLTGLFIFWIDSARSYIPQLVQAPYTTVYTLPFGYMAQSCSIYFTVAAAFDCYVCVCWRRRSKQHCTVSRARRIVGAIVLLSVLYNSLRFPQFNLRKCIHEGSGDMIVEICPTSLFFRINTVYNVYLYMVVMTLFPFLVLLLLNLFIICRKSIDSNRQKQKRKRSTSSIVSSIPTTANASLCGSSRGSNHPRNNQQQQQAINGQPNNSSSANATSPSGPAKAHIAAALLGGPMAQFPQLPKAVSPGSDETITMIMVVILFLCCNTLALVVNLIETFFEPDALLLNLLSDASNFLVIFNSSVNCVIYLIFNSEYREVFFAHFVHFKGRCYPFHLLQCLFERNPRNDQPNRANGNGAAMNWGSQGGIGGGMPNGYGNSSHGYTEKSSCHEMAKSLTANGPESPVWLQCPCAASPNRLHAHCHHHHHHCHCWQPSNCHAFEWTNFMGRKAANLAADDFEEGDSGCDEENCSNTQQQMSIMGGIASSACPSPVCKQHNNQNHHHHPSARHSCYLAEVKMIVGNEAAAMPSPPHIYVRPLMRRDPTAAAGGGGGTFDRGILGRNNRSGYSAEPLDFMDDAAATSIFIDSSDAGDSGEYPVTAL